MEGKIYKITSASTNLIYIGSTINNLNKRFSQHKCSNNKSSQEIIKFNDAVIELIEIVNFNDKKELHAQERYYIELNKNIVVNKVIPTRTIKEYYTDNKELIKQYQEDNKEYFKAKHAQWRLNNVESIKIRQAQYNAKNAEYIKAQRKQYRINNAEQIKQYYEIRNINKKLMNLIKLNDEIENEFNKIENEFNELI